MMHYFFLVAALFSLKVFSSTLINGAGATFPYPLYSKWFTEYQKVDGTVQINYQSIGSGGGIRQFIDKTVDFGASDAPMTEDQLKKAGAPVHHIPTVLGAVAITYNVPGAAKGLKLSSDVLADIFLGKIKRWEDARITKDNPAVKLQGDIVVVHRSDGSGTTNIFTDYLAKVSPEWKEKVGVGTAVSWPVGLGGKGNEGVSGLIKKTPGTIGYVELLYAENNKLPYAAVKNQAGEFILPTPKAVTASADGVKIPEDFRVSITNAFGKGAYPISGFTYLLIWKQMPDAGKQARIHAFIRWALGPGQTMAEPLHYAQLPKALVKRVEAALGTSAPAAKVN